MKCLSAISDDTYTILQTKTNWTSNYIDKTLVIPIV
jgi:hypothetical protein